MRYGFDILDKTLEEVGSRLERKIDIYLIGGGALSFKKLKVSTKDIDAILETKKDLELLADTLKKMNFIDVHRKAPGYEKARNMLDKEDCPSFDLFFRDICGGLHFTKGMKKRAEKWGDYSNLHLFLLSNEDIFLFKSIAGREGDFDDCVELVKQNINWKVVLEEINTQNLVTKKEWLPQFTHFVQELHNKYNINVPILKKIIKGSEKILIKNLIEEALSHGKDKKQICNELNLTKKEFEDIYFVSE